jgi:crotonobetainyl-CoA:carnitine CoA-transferase CaiB-like acyl-CoA transferase
MALPLADIRVIAVEQYGAGPWGTLQLADLGAEIVKVEDPASRGDVGRYVPPFAEGEDSLFFETFNRNKKSVSLDLRTSEGRTVFEDLVRESDAVYSNLRGDQPRKLRLTYEDLKDVNPRVVCCSLSGFGMTGPRAAEAGYDYIMQAMAGWMSLTGDPAGPPTKSGLSLVDLSGGYVSAIALLAGLWRARREGVGCDCDISLYESALHQLMYIGTWTASRDYAPRRMPESAHPSIVPFQAFATSDGWITIACAKQKFWERLCEALGRPDLLEDPRFADFAARDLHREELLPILRDALAGRAARTGSRRWPRLASPAGRCTRSRCAAGPPGRGPRRPRGARAPEPRHGPPGRLPSARRRRAGRGAPVRARPVPRRAHREPPAGRVRLHGRPHRRAPGGGRVRLSAVAQPAAGRRSCQSVSRW